MAATYHDVPPIHAIALGLTEIEPGVHTRIFTGSTDRDVYDEMDRVKGRIEAAGGREVHRTKIGRNTSCPCQSGLKYKKCCLNRDELSRAA